MIDDKTLDEMKGRFEEIRHLQTRTSRDGLLLIQALRKEREHVKKFSEAISTLSRNLLEVVKDKKFVSRYTYGTFHVEQRSSDLWAVIDTCGEVLNKKGEWEYEPMPSGRDQEFIDRTRFTLKEARAALKRAK